MKNRQASDETPFGALNFRFACVALCLVVLIWVVCYLAIVQEEEQGIAESRLQAERLAVFFEQHALGIFRYGDAYLKMVRREYEASRSLDAVRALLDEVPLDGSITSHVTVMDEFGTPLLVSGHQIKSGSTAKDRDYFLSQKRAATDELLISQPHRGRNSGLLTIRLVRRYLKPDGGFGGIIFVAIKADYVTDFFNTMGLGAQSSATLVGTDKRIRARSSYGRLGPGQDISGSQLWGLLERGPVGSYQQLSVVDGVTRIYNYRALDEFPLIVAIGVSAEDSLGNLGQYKALAYSISVLATFLVIITMLLFSRERGARRQLENSERHARTIMDTVLGGIVSVDDRGIVESFSRGAVKMFGYREAEIVGRPVTCLSNHPSWVEFTRFPAAGERADAAPALEGAYREAVALNKAGETFPVEIAVGETERNGRPLRVITVHDISEKKKAALALFEVEQRAQVTLHSIGDAVISTNAEGIVDFLNPVAESLTGWKVDEAKGKPLREVFRIIDNETRAPARDPVEECIERGEVTSLQSNALLLRRDGREYAIEDSAAPIRNDGGGILGVVLVFKDVTEARQLSREVYYRASHDALTSLINRQEFERRLQRVRETAEREDSDNVLCYIDLDQFKVVNDTCGHVAGDELLRQVAGLMQSCVR